MSPSAVCLSHSTAHFSQARRLVTQCACSLACKEQAAAQVRQMCAHRRRKSPWYFDPRANAFMVAVQMSAQSRLVNALLPLPSRMAAAAQAWWRESHLRMLGCTRENCFVPALVFPITVANPIIAQMKNKQRAVPSSVASMITMSDFGCTGTTLIKLDEIFPANA